MCTNKAQNPEPLSHHARIRTKSPRLSFRVACWIVSLKHNFHTLQFWFCVAFLWRRLCDVILPCVSFTLVVIWNQCYFTIIVCVCKTHTKNVRAHTHTHINTHTHTHTVTHTHTHACQHTHTHAHTHTLHMHTHMPTHTHTYIYHTHTHTHTHMHTYTHTPFMPTHMPTHTHTYILYTHTHTHTHTHTCTYTYTHTHSIHAHTHAHTHTHTYIYMLYTHTPPYLAPATWFDIACLPHPHRVFPQRWRQRLVTAGSKRPPKSPPLCPVAWWACSASHGWRCPHCRSWLLPCLNIWHCPANNRMQFCAHEWKHSRSWKVVWISGSDTALKFKRLQVWILIQYFPFFWKLVLNTTSQCFQKTSWNLWRHWGHLLRG